jgi:hypothetical protein
VIASAGQLQQTQPAKESGPKGCPPTASTTTLNSTTGQPLRFACFDRRFHQAAQILKLEVLS